MKENQKPLNTPKKKRHTFTKTFLLVIVILIVAGAAYYYLNQEKIKAIEDFDDCVAAGFPAMDPPIMINGYTLIGDGPRQCFTIDARIFPEEEGIRCASYLDCGQGTYCKKNRCKEFIPENKCVTDTDCILIDSTYGFGCCWAGRCDQIDLSQKKWIPVNTRWFAANKTNFCPKEDVCGPAPMCPTTIVNGNYSAKCFDSSCRKYSDEDKCLDECGNGACQQAPCETGSCPCAETRESCRTDCAKPGIPNPAAEYCQTNNGTHQIETSPEGIEEGTCTLPDGMECGEWAYYRGKCGRRIEVTPGTNFSIKINETAEIKAKKISLLFLEVSEDSRCPKGVECAWAGRLVALFRVAADNKYSVYNLTLRGTDSQTEPITAGRYEIRLLDILPYPQAGKEPDLNDYYAEFIFTRKSSETDYSCNSSADCAIKNVGNLCGRYDLCVNKNYSPKPPELDSAVCGFPDIDGCTCMKQSCVGTSGGEVNIN